MPFNFEYLKLPRRGIKPRVSGITMIRDQGLSPHQVLDVLEAYDEYIDYVKIKQFELWYMKPWITEEKVKLYSSHGVVPFCGGTVLEAAWLRKAVPETLKVLRKMGFPAIEVSDNIIELSDDEKKGLVTQTLKAGFEVFVEYGKKYPEGPFDPIEAAKDIRELLSAGAKYVILERSMLDLTIGSDGEGTEGDLLKELVATAGLDVLIFEAETFGQQAWLLQNFGADVSLGPNLSPEYVISKLEPARYGLGRDEGYTIFERLK